MTALPTSLSKNRSSLLAMNPRLGTNAALILACLSRPRGATLKELATATGWPPHSIRGFLRTGVAGSLRMQI